MNSYMTPSTQSNQIFNFVDFSIPIDVMNVNSFFAITTNRTLFFKVIKGFSAIFAFYWSVVKTILTAIRTLPITVISCKLFLACLTRINGFFSFNICKIAFKRTKKFPINCDFKFFITLFAFFESFRICISSSATVGTKPYFLQSSPKLFFTMFTYFLHRLPFSSYEYLNKNSNIQQGGYYA